MGVRLGDRAVRVRLALGTFTNTVADNTLAQDLEQKYGCTDHVRTKLKLLPDKALYRIRQVASDMRALIARYCLRFGDGWVLPTGLYDTFMVQYDQLKAAFEDAKEALRAEYADHLDTVRQNQGSLDIVNLLPSDADSMLWNFWVRLTIEPIEDPSQMQSKMPAHVRAEIQQNFSNFLSDSSEVAIHDALSRMQDALQHMVSKLQDPDATFKEVTVAKVRELIELMPHFNITDDKEIDNLHNQLAQHAHTLDAPTLRNNKELRSEMAEKAAAAMTVIASLKEKHNVSKP